MSLALFCFFSFKFLQQSPVNPGHLHPSTHPLRLSFPLGREYVTVTYSRPNWSQDKKVFNLEKVFHCDNFEKKSKKRQYIFNSFTVIGFSLMSDLLENKLSYNCVPYIIFLDP